MMQAVVTGLEAVVTDMEAVVTELTKGGGKGRMKAKTVMQTGMEAVVTDMEAVVTELTEEETVQKARQMDQRIM